MTLPTMADRLVHSGSSLDHHLEMDFAAVVRASLEDGATPDQVAQDLIDVHHVLPISAIKAMRSGANMTSDEAKAVILRNLPEEQRNAAERLWEMFEPGGTGVGDGA